MRKSLGVLCVLLGAACILASLAFVAYNRLEEKSAGNASLELLQDVQEEINAFSVEESLRQRIPVPRYLYYGKEIWEEAITALLCGENLLLVGPKATGKNVLAENLAAVFGRPSWDVSFYINTDAATLLGTDTFADGNVTLRKGPIYQCAEKGGFGILDEINMAKNESLAVLHATLDFRRAIDMPGYDRIRLHKATRFIATMNYGYAGTRELNEALASRFVVIDMPPITMEDLIKLLCREYPALRPAYAEQFASLFQDIQKKCDGGELSTKPLDLRGLVAAVRLIQTGLEGNRALELGLVNKSFDDFEKQLVTDVIRTRLPETLTYEDVFA
jgi:MoxR-like ATPase